MDLAFLNELLEKGGIVMWFLLPLSVYVVAVILFKLVQFWKHRQIPKEFMYDVVAALEAKKLPEALRIASNALGPVAQVAVATLQSLSNKKLTEDKREQFIEATGLATLRPLESHMKGLEIAGNISPLLGLLGTVIGMVSAFSNIEQLGSRVDPSMLAGGIWEALLTTVAGLSVAIPAVVAHYLFEGHLEKLRSSMREAVALILSRHVG